MLNGFWKLTWVETKVFMREPMGFLIPLAMPVILFIFVGRALSFGELEAGQAVQAPFNLPILFAVVIALQAIVSLVVIISIYREGGILKRLRATPLSPGLAIGRQPVSSPEKHEPTDVPIPTAGLRLLSGGRQRST